MATVSLYILLLFFSDSTIVQLLGLDLWQPDCEARKEISEKITHKLQEDASIWIDKELDDIDETSLEIKDKILPEIERFISKLAKFIIIFFSCLPCM